MYYLRIVSKEGRVVVRKSKSKLKVLRPVKRSVKVLAKSKRGLQGEPGIDGKVQELIAGPGIIVDDTDASKPVVSATGGSGDKNFVYDFTMQHTLYIQHNLQKYPSATVINSAGDKVEGTVDYIDINNIIVQFTAPFSGKVTLN